MIVKDKKGYLLLENNGVSGLEPRALIIKFEFLICNRVSLPDKCKALTPRTPRPPIEFVISIKLITPIAIEEGLRFAIREGGRTVGSGAVTSINE